MRSSAHSGRMCPFFVVLMLAELLRIAYSSQESQEDQQLLFVPLLLPVLCDSLWNPSIKLASVST